MAEIFPFNAYRYNLERVNLSDVITQPYDKITPAMQDRYLKLPYNLITIEKGKPEPGDSASNNVYTRADQLWSELHPVLHTSSLSYISREKPRMPQ